MFNAPGVPTTPGPCCLLRPGGDPRTPDIIVAPNVGVVYTGSAKKQSEHGGFAHDDTNVMLLVSNPDIKAQTVTSFVETDQVAPTILQLLGLGSAGPRRRAPGRDPSASRPVRVRPRLSFSRSDATTRINEGERGSDAALFLLEDCRIDYFNRISQIHGKSGRWV